MYVAFLVFWGGLWPSFFQIAKLLDLKDRLSNSTVPKDLEHDKLKQTLKQTLHNMVRNIESNSHVVSA